MKILENNNKKVENKLIPAINFHILKSCNMKCKYCFAKFRDCTTSQISLSDCKSILVSVKKKGFEKVTFSGGEPLMVSCLPELISFSKEIGLTTMSVTNGSLLTDHLLMQMKGNLDWIGLSVDSLDMNINRNIGRHHNGQITDYRSLIAKIKLYSYRLKINTVVSKMNCEDDTMGAFIKEVKPERWKILRALEIEGENCVNAHEFIVTDDQFTSFLERNNSRPDLMVSENNEDMKGTYVMISPEGSFFSNSAGDIKYSSTVLKRGIDIAYDEMQYSYEGFENRKGLYDWR